MEFMKSFAPSSDFNARKGIECWENEGGRISPGGFDSFASKRDNHWRAVPQVRSELSEPAIDDLKPRPEP